MTLTLTDLFCGAGGSSSGAAAVPGVEITMAANHWPSAIDLHQHEHPAARHDCADITQVDFRRYPATDILLASPECTNHAASKGISRKRQQANLFETPDPAAERSRSTMWDVIRYAEIHTPAAIIVENVVEAANWIFYPAWRIALDAAGYEATVCSINSMHTAAVPQSRDRIYVVAVRRGIKVDLDLHPHAYCHTCAAHVAGYQSWKPGRTVGRYRQQYLWRCPTCHHSVEPYALPAAAAIDWTLPTQRIGERKRPLAPATMRRIALGLARYGYAIVAGAGQTWERPGSDYARAWPLHQPLPVQTATLQHALATPALDAPTEPAFIAELRGGGSQNKMRPATDPLATVEANGNHHALVCPPLVVETAHTDRSCRARPVTEPLRTITADDDRPLIIETPDATKVEAFYVKGFGSGLPRDGQMVHPTTKPFGTVTAQDHHGLLVPYYRTGWATPTSQPIGTINTRDRYGLVQPCIDLDQCTFRMLEPHEVGAAMAFRPGYGGPIMAALTKRDKVRAYGNAVTPPVMTWLVSQVAHALAAAA
jgi:DNA (cytosine-5)-methyltransferase 1